MVCPISYVSPTQTTVARVVHMMISKAVQDNHMLLKRLLPAHTVALLAEDLAEYNNNGCGGHAVPHATRSKCRWHRKKNESCVTQANTGYLEKAKFILARIDPRIDSF